MGEVYRATDSRLRREVAIKVLPADVGGDPQRLRRFEQEARAASALNHPNVLIVHDIGGLDAAPYVVTELLDGSTLREHLTGVPLPWARAVAYAVEVARGLAAAHDRAIVHRDIKPENLFVTRDGRVKILDFGIATIAHADTSAAMTTRQQTEPGILLGTVGYMSPEQVKGDKVDSRSDIFALGVVLYEMLAGQPPFGRGSRIETISAILTDTPGDLSACERQCASRSRAHRPALSGKRPDAALSISPGCSVRPRRGGEFVGSQCCARSDDCRAKSQREVARVWKPHGVRAGRRRNAWRELPAYGTRRAGRRTL